MHNNFTASTSPLRPPQDNVPRSKELRNKLFEVIRDYVAEAKPVGPVSLDELREHSEHVIKLAKVDDRYLDFIAVCINNEIWRDTVAAIPYDRRLLLLPRCLRNKDKCKAQMDELGLICERCGQCVIDELQGQAEQLGYAVLVAEGSPVVMSLIESGQIEAVIGVSCLSVLENTFPYMEAGAIPGIAIPLLNDGCTNTSVDVEWVLDAIYENSQKQSGWLDLRSLRKQVDQWFTAESLESILPPVKTSVERLSLDWLVIAGKRWRPFLAVSTFHALAENPELIDPCDLAAVAVAVECFHKASLVHDDIEDDDDTRYGQATLHAEHGVPIALNVGDLLLGEGYQLLTQIKTTDERKVRMLHAAAQGHRYLCLGQGNELAWMAKPMPLSVDEVIDIFRKKTSPAFEVALKIGAIFAGADDKLAKVLNQYSDALGIAYQIKDDIADFSSDSLPSDLNSMRPSLLLAIGYERAKGEDRKILESVWKRSVEFDKVSDRIRIIFADLNIERAAMEMMESYKSMAIGSLASLQNARLKGLLRRVICSIFNDIEVMGCCDDFTTGHAGSGEQG